MQKKTPALIAANFDLAAGEELIADGAKTPVVERRPFSVGVGRTQDFQSIFGPEGFHHARHNDLRKNAAISRRYEPVIQKILTLPTTAIQNVRRDRARRNPLPCVRHLLNRLVQLMDVDRLCQVNRKTSAAAPLNIVLRSETAHGDSGQCLTLFRRAHDVAPISIRQANVADQQIEARAIEQPERALH